MEKLPFVIRYSKIKGKLRLRNTMLGRVDVIPGDRELVAGANQSWMTLKKHPKVAGKKPVRLWPLSI